MVSLAFAALLGCQGEKAGDPCDKFFQNTCKAPLSCVDVGDNKVCAGSCDWTLDPMPPHNTCKDPALEPASVDYMQGTTNVGGAGCYCLPKKGGASAKPSAAASSSPPPAATSASTAPPAPSAVAAPSAAPTSAPTAHPKPAPKKK
jgi:hypothetical protein